MALHRTRILPKVLALALCSLLLGGCENSATAFHIDSNQQALTLIREQQFFWQTEVAQAIVVSRMPACQRRVRIHPDATTMTPVEVYEAGDRLWALRQNARWYLASTAACQVQDWNNAGNEPPGALIGYFASADGETKFVTVQNSGNR